jgi:hypothetical protein
VTRLRGLLPPLVAFLCEELVLLGAAWAAGVDPFSSASLARWDSEHYLSIAEHGYTLFRCPPPYPAGAWCGNSGWFPLYPLLVRALGPSYVTAGAAVSAIARFLTFVLLWRELADQPRKNAWLALFTAAAFFGAVYQRTVFPVSLFTLLSLATLAFARRRRYLAAGLAGALAATAYSTGFLLAPVLALAALCDGRRLKSAAVSAGAVLLGFASVLALHAATVGAWNAFFLVQSKYGHGLGSPLAPLLRAGSFLVAGSPELIAIGAETIAISALVVVLVVRAIRDGADKAPLFFVLIFWLVPLALGRGVHLYRAEALLVPACLLTVRWPPAWQVALLAVAGTLLPVMDYLFFTGVLI